MKSINPITLPVLVFFSLMVTGISQAQNKFTVSGSVNDGNNGEKLIATTISIKELHVTVTNANEYGFYSITLSRGKYTLITSYTGYEPKEIKVVLNQNVRLNFNLDQKVNQLQEVVVTNERRDANVTGTQMGAQKLDMKQMNSLPVLFGEKNLLKTIQLLPHIVPVGEGSSGFYVRMGHPTRT